MRVYRGVVTLHEHVYFASREMGILFASEPVLGNYALTYALGLCHSPYYWSGGPRYKQDLAPLNDVGIYVTPGSFSRFYFAFQQFNAQSDTYYSRFDQNAIGTVRGQKTRANNFPQAGKLRMLGIGSEARFYVLSAQDTQLALPTYIRLGKFQSKARIRWSEIAATRVQAEDAQTDVSLNAADVPLAADLRILSLTSVHPAPIINIALLNGPCWRLSEVGEASSAVFPDGLRYGVEALP